MHKLIHAHCENVEYGIILENQLILSSYDHMVVDNVYDYRLQSKDILLKDLTLKKF